MAILGRASTMSSQVVNVRHPILCAQLIAYLALSLQSCAVLPLSTCKELRAVRSC